MMATVVVGGHSRSVGKTSVVAGLIAAMPEMHWTAVKITQFGHGVCANGSDCDCATDVHTHLIEEDHDRSGESDSSRFLVAGADRSLWVRTKQGMLAEAMPDLRANLSPASNVIIESNSVMKFLRPDLYLTVLDFGNNDFKESARRFLDLASAVILNEGPLAPGWDNVSLKLIQGKPVFRIHPPVYITEEIVEFVRQRLSRVAAETPRY